MHSFSTPSRRSFDLPKPDTGLAEWTSKIKAIQRQVDADEENEQKRLEEEIAAARQARLRRRSRGAGGDNPADSLDRSGSREYLGMSTPVNDTSADVTPKSFSERQDDRDTALRKLMDRNHVYNPDKVRPDTKTDSVSLASFMGSRATGPRLNRHAPQTDAHDPTQFIQPDLTAPHPVFGTGGVALPTMTSKRESKSPVPIAGSEMAERYRPSSAKSSPVPAARHDISRLEEPSRKDINRRSFTATPKSPSPALAQRYAEKLNTPTTRDVKATPDLILTKQKSNGSISAPLSPLPATVNRGHSSTYLSTSPSKSTDYRAISTTSSVWKGTQTSTYAPSDREEKPLSSFSTTSAVSKSSSVSSLAPSEGVPAVSSSTTFTALKPIQRGPNSLMTYGGSPAGPIPTYSLPRKGVSSSSTKEDTPLRRLMDRNNVFNPDKLQSENSRKSVAERAPLAAFIGGSGKGIRLNKHAPQADAHDPTQFIQPDVSAPHPIFGKGGVAMPGMVTRKSVPDTTAGIDSTELYKPSSTKKATWPPASSAEDVEERAESPQKMGGRARTTSAPRLEPQTAFRGSQTSSWTPSRVTERSRSPTKDPVAIPLRDRTLSTPSATPSQQAIPPPSLARPIQPNPTSSLSPQIPVTVASPAFNKPSAQKDLTPSLSRLQGRGFVQNMVKASAQIPGSPTQPPSRPGSTTGKKVFVLDRWQQNVQSGSPTKSTSTAPFATGVVKPTTSGSLGSSGGLSSQGLKPTTSLPSLSKPTASTRPTPLREGRAATDNPYPRSRTPGLGSATTMVVIKPSKSFTDLTELGVKSGRHDPQLSDPDPDPSSRKTPIYLSRDKAHEPKKKPNLQRLTESPVRERNEDVISVPHSAPASAPSFNIPPQRHKAGVLASPITLPSELKADPVNSPDPIVVRAPIERMETSSTTLEAVSLTAPSSTETHTSPTTTKERSNQPSSPVKHSRIPSTGNRPTVMEVAQALNSLPNDKQEVQPSNIPATTMQDILISPTPVSGPKVSLSQAQAEKRRSNYERYSAIILPSLPEEATPVSSPAGTLKAATAAGGLGGILEAEEYGPSRAEEPRASKQLSDVVHIPVVGEPHLQLHSVDITELLRSRRQPLEVEQPADVQTISVEVLSIVANSATMVSKMPYVFHDTEILAIVHRVKSKASGLASTSVWCWLGKQSSLRDREEKKLHELSKRYGTSAKLVHHLAEPIELAQILEGRIAIRQGTRNHWTSENTTMHLIRSLGDVILIDEQDFNIKNLCSAFSYCFTILGSIYVWHGCGSTQRERRGALDYAQTLSPDPTTPIELFEGESDADEMFWMVLGDDDFARADYWRWRPSCSERDPLIWRIDRNATKPVIPVEFMSMEQHIQESVYVINCIWELFVLVGKNARGHRKTIRWAVELSKKLSSATASERPYAPTVHVLILPSQLPIDLRLGVRDLDEAWVNNGEIPRHMNLISCSEAITHLDTHSWELATLKDPDMLPLGVDPSVLP